VRFSESGLSAVRAQMFDAFLEVPTIPTADGVANLSASLERVLQTADADIMPWQR
jgi:hypothetical protein